MQVDLTKLAKPVKSKKRKRDVKEDVKKETSF